MNQEEILRAFLACEMDYDKLTAFAYLLSGDPNYNDSPDRQTIQRARDIARHYLREIHGIEVDHAQ